MKIITKRPSNLDIAENLFYTLQVGRYIEYEKQVNEVLNKCTTRQEILDTIIRLCEVPTTPKGRYILAMAHSWSNTEHRLDAIKYISDYLNNELYSANYEGVFSGFHYKGCNFEIGTIKRTKLEKDIHISAMYLEISKKYEEQYMFNEAKSALEQSLILTPFHAHIYVRLSRVLEKRNELDNAMEVLEKAKFSQYYEPYDYEIMNEKFIDGSFKMVIDNSIAMLQGKIDKGYVYKPRQRKKMW